MKFRPLHLIVLTLGLAGATAHAQHHAGGNPLPTANNPLAQLNGFGTGYNNPLHQGAGFGTGFNNAATQGGGVGAGFSGYNYQSFAQPTIIVGGGYNSGFAGYGYNNYNYYSNQGFGYGGGYALTPNLTGVNGNFGNGLNTNGLNPNVGGAARSNPNISAVLNGTNAAAPRPSSKSKSSKATKRASSRRR